MKEKTSKIIVITSLSLIGILILTVLLLAVIPIHRGFNFEQQPDVVTLKKSNGQVVLYANKEDQKATYNEVLNMLNAGGDAKILDSIYNGSINAKSGVERLNRSQPFSELYDSADEYCLILRWYTPLSAKYVNDNKQTVTYEYDVAYIQLNSNNGINKIYAYLKEYNKTNTYSYVASYTWLNTSALYDYATKLEYNPV